MSAVLTAEADGLIGRIGARVRRARTDARLSRRALSEASGVSERYLALLEGGKGNISIGLLARVADALDFDIAQLVATDEVGDDPETARFARLFQTADPGRRARAMAALATAPIDRAARVCLIGLRGAGKSTLGRLASQILNAPFLELGDEIEALAGLPVGEVIALYGQEGYRELERQALERAAESHDRLVLAVAGGIVEAPETFDLLRARFHTIWLKAAPNDHMQRVRRQGDERPMIGHPRAMDELRAILERRTALYAEADVSVETSGKTQNAAAADVAAAIVRLSPAASR